MVNILSFFEQNFGTFAPYTLFNTLIYGIILSLFVFLLLWIFKRQKVKLNDNFFVAVAPWVVFGTTSRALVDASFFPTIWFFVAPGIYFLIFVLFVVAWVFSIFASRFFKIEWWKPLFVAGFVLTIFNILIIALRAQNLQALLFFSIIFGIACAPFAVAWRFKVFSKIFTKQNLLVVAAHLFDVSATFVALTFFGYVEKHVLPAAIMGLLGPAAFFILKLLVVIPCLMLTDHFIKDKNTKNMLKFVLFVLGFAPGFRDLSRIIMMC